MTYSSTIETDSNAPTVFGNMKVAYGTFTVETGTPNVETSMVVDTGMREVSFMSLQYDDVVVESAKPPVVNESSYPTAGGSVSIKAFTNTSGLWFAIGR